MPNRGGVGGDGAAAAIGGGGDGGAAAAGVVSEDKSSGGGLLSKFSRKLMGGRDDGTNNSGEGAGGEDTYVRGPSPIFTAKLANVAPFTSTALTAQAYGNCNNNSPNDGNRFEEDLNLAIETPFLQKTRFKLSKET